MKVFVRYKNCFVADADLQANCESCGCYVPECRSLGSAHSGRNWTPSAGELALGHTALGHLETLGTAQSLCACVRTCARACVCIRVCEYVHRMSPQNDKHIVSCQGLASQVNVHTYIEIPPIRTNIKKHIRAFYLGFKTDAHTQSRPADLHADTMDSSFCIQIYTAQYNTDWPQYITSLPRHIQLGTYILQRMEWGVKHSTIKSEQKQNGRLQYH